MDKYEKVARQFQKFFHSEEISVLMDQKADKSMLTMKANMDEITYTHSLIEGLNERIKHISMIQTEFAKTLEPIKNSIGEFDN